MCGISGIWNSRKLELSNLIQEMNKSLAHRGPDSHGQWLNDDCNIGFGHTRLAIIDTSKNGSQPMHSSSDRFVIVFNGEIYNHLDLREEINSITKSVIWKGFSDTETILASLEVWGVKNTLEKLCGMFAMAIWDDRKKKLYLARDRAGEKPLYYFQSNGLVCFASEPKAFFSIPHFSEIISIDPSALAGYIKYSYVPDSIGIFRSMEKVQPGTITCFDDVFKKPKTEFYWSFKNLISASRKINNKKTLNYEEDCENILSKVIRSQMLSDVPIGSFLSGGIDSSLVTMLMQRNASRPIKTFSIGFKESRFNESEYAADISNFLETEHTEFIVKEEDILEIVPSLASIYDEPFADSSQLPTILLSKLARDQVTVALTGDGGDEVFGGYNRHIFGPKLWKLLVFMPSWIKVALAKAISLSNIIRHQDQKFVNNLIRMTGLPITFIERIAVMQRALEEAENFQELHLVLASAFSNPQDYINFSNLNFQTDDFGYIFQNSELSHAEQMMAFDTVSYLRGDILVKVDRASMHSSLETRAPFLDKRIIEYSWQMPIKHKIDGKMGKKILRKILNKHIPQSLTDRPKQGFSIPINKWLRGELFEWADKLLCEEKLIEHKLINSQSVQKLWHEHNSLKANHGQQLWTILMLQSWLEHHASTFFK